MPWRHAALLMVSMSACGGAATTSTHRASPIAPLPASSASAPTPEQPLTLAWTTETKDWNHHLFVAPTGELVAIASSKIYVLDAKTGAVSRKGEACSSPHNRSFGWLDATRFALVCDEVFREYEWPSLTFKDVAMDVKNARSVGLSCNGGAVNPRLVVASDVETLSQESDVTPLTQQPLLLVYDPRGWKKLVEENFAEELVNEVAIAPDGSAFAFPKGDSIEIREAGAGHVTATIPLMGSSPWALSYSPDAKYLFAYDGDAAVFEIATQRRVRTYKVGQWLSQSQWLADGTVVATGAEGLWVFSPNGKSALVKMIAGGSGLAVSNDGTLVWVGDSNGQIRMYRMSR